MIIYSLGPPTVPVHHHTWLVVLLAIGLAGAYMDLKRRRRRRDNKAVSVSRSQSMPIEQVMTAMHQPAPWAANLSKLEQVAGGYDPRGLPAHNFIGSDGTPVCYGRGCMCCR